MSAAVRVRVRTKRTSKVGTLAQKNRVFGLGGWAVIVSALGVGCVRFSAESIPNEAPFARANERLIAAAGGTVVLDGSGSSDPDGDPISFQWSQVEAEGQPVSLANATSAVATFVAPGTSQSLFFRLIVNDGAVDSSPLVVRVDVTVPENGVPVALAPERIEAASGEVIVLDGRGSTDPDGGELTYRWNQVEGGGDPVTLRDATSAVASFTAPDVGQRMFFRLIVNDGQSDSPPAIVLVVVNGRPIALGGPSLSVPTETPVLIEGNGFDPDGDDIQSYRWSVTSAPPAGTSCLAEPSPCLSGAETREVTFTPTAKGGFVLSLVVSDGFLDSIPDTVQVQSTSRKPVAVPSASSALVPNGSQISLDAAGSFDADPDESLVGYQWRIVSTPTGGVASFNPPSGAVATPSLSVLGKGSYFVELVVTDSSGLTSDPSVLRIDTTNSPPTVFGGPDATVTNGGTITLSGTANDFDEDPLSVQWTLVDSPPDGVVSLIAANTLQVTFTPNRKTLVADPALCAPGLCYQLALVASDGVALSPVDTVYVTSLNRPPVANPGPNRDATGVFISLDGTDSIDPDGDTNLTYTWTQRSGDPDVTGGVGFLVGGAVDVPAPEVGVYEFILVVSDGDAQSAPSTVLINVGSINRPPVWTAFPNPEAIATEGTNFVGLSGGSATDPEGDPVTIQWIRRPGASPLFPARLTGASPSFTAPSFLALLEFGQTFADYDVSATDGTFATEARPFRAYVRPGNQFIVVAPDGSDVASCGDVANPCATLPYALDLVEAVENTFVGDGRDIVMTSGLWRGTTSRGLEWVGRTSLYAGRDPRTFARSTPSELVYDTVGCINPGAGMELYTTVTDEVLFDNARLVLSSGSGCLTNFWSIRCDDCGAQFQDIEVSQSIARAQCTGVRVEGSAAVPTFTRVGIRVGNCSQFNLGYELVQGASVVIEDSEVTVTSAVTATRSAGIYATASSVVATGLLSVVSGPASTNPTALIAGLYAQDSATSWTNTVIDLGINDEVVGLQSDGGQGTVVNVSIFGPGLPTGVGIRAPDAPLFMMNSAIEGFAVALELATVDDEAALNSRIFHNAFAATTAVLARCASVDQISVESLNGPSGSACNTSAFDWEGNLARTCPVVDRPRRDYRLNAGLDNPCLAAGVNASPAGVAPPTDREGNARPTNSPDIGASERP